MRLRRSVVGDSPSVADDRVRSDCHALFSLGSTHFFFTRDPGRAAGLKRWHLVESRLFSVGVNRLTTPVDPGPPHDHVRGFVSIPLRRGYLERRTDPTTGESTEHWRRPLVPYVQRASDFHVNAGAPKGPCWTLIFYGPTRKPAFHFLLGSGRVVTQVEFSEMVKAAA